jgi:diguanylate cyclase (GGDEF)-like protein
MTLLRWLLPGGLVAAVTLVVWAAADPNTLLTTVADRYALLAYAMAAGLAAVFHRSRVLALVLVLAGVELAARTQWVAAPVQPVLGLLAAIAVGVGAVARDRGVTSRRGVLQVGVAVLLVGGTAVFLRLSPDVGVRLLASGDVASALGDATGWTPRALVPLGLAAMFLIWAVARRRGAVERGAVWSFGLAAAAALPAVGDDAASLFRMAAAVALGLAVLETTYAMAYRDELTGLPARRSLMRDLEGLGGIYTLAMVDVDHFKKFNDKHGHDVGDQVLRMVASRLARAPGGGKAYRYGGEEFTLLFRGLTRDEAAPHLEAVRASVAAARFSLRRWTRPVRKRTGEAKRSGKKSPARRGRNAAGGRGLSVTVSIGMADSKSIANPTPEAVLGRADKALYRAKRAGRDRVAT